MFESQSPQTGQFNSYGDKIYDIRYATHKVSIPSNGSIQFLRRCIMYNDYERQLKSQSPQTGQFNSYRKEEE